MFNDEEEILLEKIRWKETNQLLSNAIDQEKVILSRLEQTISIVQQYFIAERATTLEIDLVAKQIRECHSTPLTYSKESLRLIFSDIFLSLFLIADQAIELLHYLHRYPENEGWLVIVNLRGRDFIKINREKSINTIIETIRVKCVA